MATLDDEDNLVRKYSRERKHAALTRSSSTYHPISKYDLAKGDAKQYKQQYSDMYFLRLAKLKPVVEAVAEEAWEQHEIAGEIVSKVDRVLDVRQGELCWVAGTVYKDLSLKPNILDDILKDAWIAAPTTREKYVSRSGDKVMLEDESGRLRLVGAVLHSEMLVTGCIIAVMGTEGTNGDFEVVDIKIPDLPSQPQRWFLEQPQRSKHKVEEDVDATGNQPQRIGHKVAIVSGLHITGDSGTTLNLDLLMEFLLGESTTPSLQRSSSKVSRLVIAGDSLAETVLPIGREEPGLEQKPTVSKKYGYDAAAYNPGPTKQLDLLLSALLPSLPVTLIPGASDLANVSIPQQPLHPALFPSSRAYSAVPPSVVPSTDKAVSTKKQQLPTNVGVFHSTTNPVSFSLSGHLYLGTGGQPTDDIAKYLDPAETLDIMEATLRWRVLAPTAPDTLWCYPFQDDDPFVLTNGMCPHVYFVGNQSEFGTRLIEGESNGAVVRLISVPKFSVTGEVVLVDEETLEVEVVRFAVHEENHR